MELTVRSQSPLTCNLVIEYRAAEGHIERLSNLARELAQPDIDLIVAVATPGGLAAQHATSRIPIVVAAMGDPVRDGLVASLARPGGNITGTSFLGPELVPKRLSILKEVLPRLLRVAALWHPGAFGESTMQNMHNEAAEAASALGLQLQLFEVRGPHELEGAFSEMVRKRVEALFLFPSQMLFSERRRIVRLAELHRLPAIYNGREFAALGGLMAYGASNSDLIGRTAAQVERILKGTKPSEVPVEQPTKFDLVINLTTAKGLGLDVPATLLARADEVIE